MPRSIRKNMVVSFPNYLDATYHSPRLYGGHWRGEAPLELLQDELMATCAISVDTALASTQFDVDLAVLRGIKMIAVPDSNCSRAAQWRAIVANDPDFTDVQADTGLKDVWNVVYPRGTLPVWHPSYYDGKLTEEDRASGYRMPFLHIFPDGLIGRYVRTMIIDPDNPDGFIKLPRQFIAGGWQTTVNISLGRNLGFEVDTGVMTSLRGSKYFDEGSPYRVAMVEIDHLPEAESYAFPLEMARRLGISRQVFVSLAPEDDTRLHQNSFLARMREPRPLERSAQLVNKVSFIFEEVV